MYCHKGFCVSLQKKSYQSSGGHMTNKDKIKAIQAVRGKIYSEEVYYKLLEDMGDGQMKN